MKLPEKYRRQKERIEFKQRFADWNMELATYYTEQLSENPREGLDDLLIEGVELLEEIVEKKHGDFLASEIEQEHTYAGEFRECLLDLKRRREKLLGKGDLTLRVDDVLEEMDSLLE